MNSDDSSNDAKQAKQTIIGIIAVSLILSALVGAFVLDLGTRATPEPDANVSFIKMKKDTPDDESAPELIIKVQKEKMVNVEKIIITDNYGNTANLTPSQNETLLWRTNATDANGNGKPDNNPSYQSGDELTIEYIPGDGGNRTTLRIYKIR